VLLVAAAAAATAVVAGHQDAANAVYRYRAAIAALMQLKPGMAAAEVPGASPAVASELAPLVGGSGRVVGATLDAKTGAISLAPASVDAIVLTSALTATTEHKKLFDGISSAIKPGGVLLVVDVPQENDGKRTIGLEAEDVVKLAAAAGLKREAESGIVPGHYAIRFRKAE
jgi:predicted methyltransferase